MYHSNCSLPSSLTHCHLPFTFSCYSLLLTHCFCSFAANKFPNKPAQKSCPEIHLFVLLLLVPFIIKQNSPRNLTILIISSISSLNIINVVVLDLKILIWILASAADAAVVNSKGIEILLAYDLSTFFISGKSFFNYGPTGLPRNSPGCNK